MPEKLPRKYGATRSGDVWNISWENLRKYSLKELGVELSGDIGMISFDMTNKGGFFYKLSCEPYSPIYQNR